MKRKYKIGIGVVIAGCILTMLIAFFNMPKEKKDDVLWREYKVEKGDITASFDENGILKWDGEGYAFNNPKYDVSLKIKDILVEEGDMVKEGDALVSFDKADVEEAIQIVEEELKQAKRDLEDAKENYKNAE